MRIRRKKHLEERIRAAEGILLTACQDIHNVKEAVEDKRYINFAELFKRRAPVYMEIGCGKGGFACKVCAVNKDINYLAVELLSNIAVTGAERAKEEGINNLRFFVCGADYLARYVKPASLSRIYLNFSPPYPGLRYENRRLTKPALIADYAVFLKSGGEVFLKTDDRAFFEYSFGTLKAGGFAVNDVSAELPLKEYPSTEYETKFRAQNIPVYALFAKKISF